MGAVEQAQIDAAAQAVRVVAPEEVRVVRALVYLMSMVADDLTGVIEELESYEADTALAQHALGLVTGALAALGGMAEAPEGS